MVLIAWYRFEGNADDSIGGKHGTAHDVDWAEGKVGQGAYIDSFDAFSTGVSGFGMMGVPFSITLWVKFSSGFTGGLVNTGHTSEFHGFDSNGDGHIRFGARPPDGSRKEVTSNNALDDGEWHHIAGVNIGEDVYLYVDGELQGTDSSPDVDEVLSTGTFTINTTDRIGGGSSSSTTFVGTVDDLRFYDHALSKKEVKELSRAKTLHYRFNESEEVESKGGGGGVTHSYTGIDGGSGSGGGGSNNEGGTGLQPSTTIAGFGNDGGAGDYPGGNSRYRSAGGGGGAGEPGDDGNGSAEVAGDGGDGLYLGDVFGEQYGDSGWFGGGGGGANRLGTPGSGGLGGGGSGSSNNNIPEDGQPNTGGGGGGAGTSDDSVDGGDGGSGIVLVKYNQSEVSASGGSVSSDNGFNIHEFTSNGTFSVSEEGYVEVLVVGGGGGGAGHSGRGGGSGGGSGGAVHRSFYLNSGVKIDVSVGSGGSGGVGGGDENGEDGEPSQFGDIISDSSGYQYNAISNGAVHTSSSKTGSGAYEFDGQGDLIDSGSVPLNQNPDEFTMSAWFRLDGMPSGSWASVFCTRNGGGSDGTWVFINSSNSFPLDISYSLDFTGSSRIHSDLLFSNAISQSSWYHVVSVWDGSTFYAYLNGDLLGTYDGSGQEADVSENLTIGYDLNNGYPLGGVIDDFRIYATALSEDEVKELYKQRASLDNKGNFFAQEFDEREEGNILEKTGLYKTGLLSEVGPTNQLVGWFTFKGNKIDFLTKSEASIGTADYVMGLNGLALDIGSNEDSEGISIAPNDFGLNLNNESIAFWQKCDFPRLDSEGGSFTNWVFHWGTYYGNNSGGFGLQSGSFSRYLKGSTSSGWSNSGSIPDAHPIYDEGGWIHYVVVFDGNDRVRFYMNGHEVWTGIISDPYTGYDTNNIRFGRNMLATLENVRIYDKVLSPEEIKILYDLTRPNGPRMKKTRDGVYVKGGFDETI